MWRNYIFVESKVFREFCLSVGALSHCPFTVTLNTGSEVFCFC